MDLLSPALQGLVSAGESEKRASLETEAEKTENTHETDGNTIYQDDLSEPSTDVSIQVTSHSITSLSCSTAGFPNAALTQQKEGLLRCFSREIYKSAVVQGKATEKLHLFKTNETSNTHELYQETTATTVDTSVVVKHEVPQTDMIRVKTLQLAALQNTQFMESVTTVEPDTQQEVTAGRAVQFPGKLSNLKAFWERENTVPKIIFTREVAKQEDIGKAQKEASLDPQMYVDNMSSVLALKEMTDEVITTRSQEPTLQTKCSLSVEDVTYRANPVVIYEETDESLTGTRTELQIPGLHQCICIPLSSGDPLSLPSQPTSNSEGARPAKISDLKHFWEKEYTGPRVIVSRVKEASHLSAPGKEISPQWDLKRHLDYRETSENEEQTSSYGTKSSGVLKSLKETDKGFVSQDTLQPERSNSTGDALATVFPQQTKESQCHIPRSKDQNDEVRKSPSKTYHPSVLPTDSSSPKRSRVEGSPLKAFPIDINLQTKRNKDQQEMPTPMTRQWSSLSELKQTVLMDTKPFADIMSHPPPLHSMGTVTSFGNSLTLVMFVLTNHINT